MTPAENSPPFWIKWPLLGFLGVCITPFLILCAFAHPSADDWYMAATGEKWGFIKASVSWYMTMSGRFAQQGITCLHPIRINFGAYQIWCLLTLVSLLVALLLAIRRWFPDHSRWNWWLLTGTTACLFLWRMPSTAQGLYWVNGSNTYILPGILQLLLATVLGRECLNPDHRYRMHSYLSSGLLAIAAVGCSEVAMGFQLLFFATLSAVTYIQHRRVSRILIVAVICTVVATIVVLSSPGNGARMGLYDNSTHGHLFPALVLGAKLAISHLALWLASAPFFLFTIILLHFWKVNEMDRKTGWLLLGAALVLISGTLWGGFFIGTWSMGKALPHRAVDLIYLVFVMDWIILLRSLVSLMKAYELTLPRLNNPALLLVVFALFASLQSENNVKTAWRDLLKGDAKRYSQECLKRYEIIRASKSDDVAVPALKTRPKSLYFNDLNADSTDWRNQACADFFHKKVIRLEP